MMRKYEKYKDSRVEWIGEVPEHWEITRLKNITKLYGRIGFRGYTQNDLVPKSEGAITLSPSNMKNGTMDYSKCSYLTWAKYYESPEIIIRNEDVLFVKTGSTYGKVSYVSGLPMQSTINPQIVVFKEVRCNRKFLFYLLINNVIQDQVAFTVGGSTIPTLSQENILNYSFALPKIIEQQSIASYLDSKVGEIDNMIEKTEKKIKLYEELKKSIITHAVTKGLNPNAKMKDSGVEWIGEVPEHWEAMKVTWIYQLIGSGTTPKTDKEYYYCENGEYWLQTGDLNDGIIRNTSKQITKECVKELNFKIYPKGSLVVAMYGATIGKVGLLNIETTTNQACCVLAKSSIMLSKFSYFVFIAAKQSLILKSSGGGQPNISQDKIRNHYLPVPSIDEQCNIVEYLDSKTSTIDSQISITHKRIDLLKELKSSLITNVVTGKIKVC